MRQSKAWALGVAVLGGLGASAAAAQTAAPPPDLPALGGHELLNFALGDLNGDGVRDAAVVYRRTPEPSPRPLLVFFGRPGGGYGPVVARGNEAVLRGDEGGVLGDPFTGLSIERGALVVHHFGGSGWAWNLTDRYAWQGGAMRLIGCTDGSFHRGDPEGTASEQDANLNTRLVAWTFKPEGAARRRGRLYELWAPKGAWGPSTRVVTGDFVAEGRSAWQGPQDASFALKARWEGDRLAVQAELRDDHLGPGDRLEALDGEGRVLPLLGLKRRPLAGGQALDFGLALAPLGLAKAVAGHAALSPAERPTAHPMLPLSFRLIDEDLGQPRVVLRSFQGPKPGRLRLGAALAPSLAILDRSEFRWHHGAEAEGD